MVAAAVVPLVYVPPVLTRTIPYTCTSYHPTHVNYSGELLSKQRHYDWGLRAVKSVLRCAGTYKRDTPDLDEEPVLMRALVRRRSMCDASYYTRYIPCIHLYCRIYTYAPVIHVYTPYIHLTHL